METSDLTDEIVVGYLRTHPELLERYVFREVSTEVLQQWLANRSGGPKDNPIEGRKTSLSKWIGSYTEKRKMLEDMTQSLTRSPCPEAVLWELADCINSATDSDHFSLFLIDNIEQPEILRLYENHAEHETSSSLKTNDLEIVARYVALRKKPIRTSKLYMDERFPHRQVKFDVEAKRMDYHIPDKHFHILALPLTQLNGDISGVLQLYRSNRRREFYHEDEETALSYLVWARIALHYAQLCRSMDQQRSLNGFFLDVVKSIFQDMVSMDSLVSKIMDFAQKLVDADRASLFLVDKKCGMLYSHLFDVGDEKGRRKLNIEIRFPISVGIAGIVAQSGKVLNIKDAYADPRFYPDIDRQTGYRTKTLLCMPVYRRKESIIGVMQMVNKRNGMFTKQDEEAFETFAVYCGLALHHADLYNDIKTSEEQHKVAVDLLSYHRSCTDDEFSVALAQGIPDVLIGVDDYFLNPFEFDDMQQVRYAIYMFADLFGLEKFDSQSLLRFTLTVKKNYRRVPYHNWTHGFSVANTMYTILKKSTNVFPETESLAMFIGALCHDLDHRGKNNKFMLDTQSPLASMYSTSTMEHHHFNQTVTILHQDGHNIFNKFPHAEFKLILALIKHCILATDLALFADNRAVLERLLKNNEFSFGNPEHMAHLQAITMTASDLSASAKPWDVQAQTVDVIFKEFYVQGDEEIAAGRTPLPIMDRRRSGERPASQVGFLMNICKPCYGILCQLVPSTKPLLDMIDENLDKWTQIRDEENSKVEQV